MLFRSPKGEVSRYFLAEPSLLPPVPSPIFRAGFPVLLAVVLMFRYVLIFPSSFPFKYSNFLSCSLFFLSYFFFSKQQSLCGQPEKQKNKTAAGSCKCVKARQTRTCCLFLLQLSFSEKAYSFTPPRVTPAMMYFDRNR